MLSPEMDIKLARLKMLRFPCPTSWRPEQVTYIGMTKLRHCHLCIWRYEVTHLYLLTYVITYIKKTATLRKHKPLVIFVHSTHICHHCTIAIVRHFLKHKAQL